MAEVRNAVGTALRSLGALAAQGGELRCLKSQFIEIKYVTNADA